MRNNFASKVVFQDNLDLSFGDHKNDLLILDNALLVAFKDVAKNWKYIYPVEAGEDLKDWRMASNHIEKLCDIWGKKAHRSSRVIVVGGGSLGDFGGFFASILKRGVRLVHMPTTWLSAIDSAHGGKTALNIGGVKNQLGTFYPADEVYIFKNILFGLPHARLIDGFGETLKTFLLWEPQRVQELFSQAKMSLQDMMWLHLPALIQTKYDIVTQDPYEESGLRKKLNLGHTFGHALETATHQSHGLCVLQGLIFTLRWSTFKGYLQSKLLDDTLAFINQYDIPVWECRKDRHLFTANDLQDLLLADKKAMSGKTMDFVFLKNAGSEWIEQVNVASIVGEAGRQGWLKG